MKPILKINHLMKFYREIAKILVEEGGADVKLIDNRERTPADLAMQLGLGQSELMKYLKQKMCQDHLIFAFGCALNSPPWFAIPNGGITFTNNLWHCAL